MRCAINGVGMMNHTDCHSGGVTVPYYRVPSWTKWTCLDTFYGVEHHESI